MSDVFKQKWELGLFDGLKDQVDGAEVNISFENPEVVFIFANHDPDSKVLESVWENAEIGNELGKCNFPVLTANASSMGYCLYYNMMKQLIYDETSQKIILSSPSCCRGGLIY